MAELMHFISLNAQAQFLELAVAIIMVGAGFAILSIYHKIKDYKRRR